MPLSSAGVTVHALFAKRIGQFWTRCPPGMKTCEAALPLTVAHHIARRTSLLGDWLDGHSKLASRCRSQTSGFGTYFAPHKGAAHRRRPCPGRRVVDALQYQPCCT